MSLCLSLLLTHSLSCFLLFISVFPSFFLNLLLFVEFFGSFRRFLLLSLPQFLTLFNPSLSGVLGMYPTDPDYHRRGQTVRFTSKKLWSWTSRLSSSWVCAKVLTFSLNLESNAHTWNISLSVGLKNLVLSLYWLCRYEKWWWLIHLQANDRSPGYFVRLDKPRAVDDLLHRQERKDAQVVVLRLQRRRALPYYWKWSPEKS